MAEYCRDITFLPADLLFFAGRGYKSRLIAAATNRLQDLLRGNWFSHCGFIAAHGHRNLLFESTTLCDLPCCLTHRRIRGVQAHDPRDRIAAYDGHVWLLRLVDRDIHLTPDRGQRLTSFAIKRLGTPYDYEGAPVSATVLLKTLDSFHQDLDKLFCSAYLMAALKAANIVDHDINAATFTPAAAREKLLYWGTYMDMGCITACITAPVKNQS